MINTTSVCVTYMFKICFDYLYPALRPTHYAVDSRRKGGEFHPNIRICDFLGGLLFRYVPQKFKFFIILRNVNYIFPNTKTLMPLGQYMHPYGKYSFPWLRLLLILRCWRVCISMRRRTNYFTKSFWFIGRILKLKKSSRLKIIINNTFHLQFEPYFV